MEPHVYETFSDEIADNVDAFAYARLSRPEVRFIGAELELVLPALAACRAEAVNAMANADDGQRLALHRIYEGITCLMRDLQD